VRRFRWTIRLTGRLLRRLNRGVGHPFDFLRCLTQGLIRAFLRQSFLMGLV
jgi:hypothetical protein